MPQSPASVMSPDQVEALGLAFITLARQDRQIVLEHFPKKTGRLEDVGALQPDEALIARLAVERPPHAS